MFGTARAQGFPTKPISIITAYPPGGPADTLARALGETMTERLGQPVIVENRPGAGGQIAGPALLKAQADGHTLLIADNATLGINKAVYPNFNHDPQVDFVPIAPLMLMPMVLFVPKASPFNSLADVIAAAKTRPLNYASQGIGSIGHLLGEMLNADIRGQLNHIPYQGSAPAMNSLLAGQVDLLFDGVGPGLQHLKADKIKALAVAGPRRLAQIPDVPTTAEGGVPDVSMALWLGIVAKTGTPAPAVQKLHDEIVYAIQQPKTSKRFTDLGFQLLTMSPDEFRAFVKKEAEKSAAIVKERRIVLQ